MPRYIDADDLIGRMHFMQFADGEDRSLVYALIDMQPTADVVEVVRCKDCKYGHMYADANIIPLLSCNYHNAHGMLVENHGYCKWGKRKETEDG